MTLKKLRTLLIILTLLFCTACASGGGGGEEAVPNATQNPPTGDIGGDTEGDVGEVTEGDTGGDTGDDTGNDSMITFEKTYGTSIDEFARTIQQTADNGFIIAGKTLSRSGLDKDILLIKTNAEGNLSWTQTIGGIGNDLAYAVVQTSDGGFALAGYTQSSGAGNKDMYLVKTDGNGNVLWSETYGGPYDDTAVTMELTADNGFILAGGTASAGVGSQDMYLVRTDANGNALWSRTFGDYGWDLAYSVTQTADGGFVLAGESVNYGECIKTNHNGELQWVQNYSASTLDSVSFVRQITGGGFILVGIKDFDGQGTGDISLLKTNTTGTEVWSRSFGGGGTDYPFSVQETTDNGYMVAGFTESFGSGGRDLYLLRTDANGDHVWDNYYGGTYDDAAYAVQQTSDGGFIAAGETNSSGAGQGDFYVVKTDPDGNLL